MINFEEFQEYIQLNLHEFLADEYKNAIVSLNKVTKNNGMILHALNVRLEDSDIAPNIYLDGFFKKYEEGQNIDLLMHEISKIAMDHMVAPDKFAFIGKDFQNFDLIKDKIIMVAVNAEKNKILLEGVPHINKEDLALIYKVVVDNSNDGMATILIKNEHMKMWGTTTETVNDLAMRNTKEILPVTVQSMNEVMREMFSNDGMPDDVLEEMFADMPVNQQMYIISNTAKLNGAVSIFYKESLSELAEKIGTDLYILPSSVHECIAVSTDMGTPEKLAEMVQEVNGSQVSAEEQLSDHVYKFDARTQEITLADNIVENIEQEKSNAEAQSVNNYRQTIRHRR